MGNVIEKGDTHALEPDTSANVLAGHAVQLADPVLDVAVPAAHGLHTDAPAAENEPAGHGVGCACPTPLKKPVHEHIETWHE